ncbi:TetR/AcrR family transcriptional regulator [Salinicoccus halodurans]|uniref:TetR family transcriptional regulator n=1 Tax=Salinicoccus halodurans TaxID=407035 RepID=A0A0F7HLX8_9STAP|nr:TetR/AcrR family transcriptional regulator [Salinicoccus halodurans]AKG74603.1 TetR family transcriptional regulator [Salinicoccus halodurans]SFK89326.1 transcriptional regulator, TetR family [Salinicoccus halodurans]
MAKVSKKMQLLEAAADIVNEHGSDYLTLDAVAERAGVSKGGLIYHFKNKDALIRGLVEHANQLYRDNVDRHIEPEDDSNGRWLRAFIEATRQNRVDNADITSGMLAAQGINRELLTPLQKTYGEWQANIENDEIDNVDATIIRLAVDGLWLSEIFGLDAIDDEMREKILDRLSSYTEK